MREPLARGGMGTVWVARHIELDVDVAVKFRTSPDALEASAVDRFKREAQAAARLKSAHVVHIHDYGVDAGVPYIAMELLEGEDLGDRLDREERLSLSHTARLVAQAAKGLDCAHAAGIVHRDIKPRNLFLARQGGEEVLKVLDFGIAKQTLGTGTDGTTSANVILGSPNYMSPEQARGLELDASSDVWSLAAVAYRALTGVPPFVGSNSQDTVIKICTEQARPPSRQCPDLPDGVDAVFERALSREPQRRFASALELASALLDIAKTHPAAGGAPVARPPSTPRGRSTATETLASPASTARPSVQNQRPRWPLWGAVVALVLVGYGLLSRRAPSPTQAPKLATPAPTRTQHAPAGPTPLGTPEPTDPSAQAPPAASPTSPAPSPKPTTTGQARAPRPQPGQRQPKPVAPPALDPVFGLPVAPEASTTP